MSHGSNSGALRGARARAAVIAALGGLLIIPGRLTGAPAIADPALVEVQVLSINDFHGRIEAEPPAGSAGAAALATAVAESLAANPNTVLVSAGDNIGASTFTSFIAHDEPTIDALLAAGLQVSAVGNHEFDLGFADLRDRVLPRYAAGLGGTETGGRFGLGANVYLAGTQTPALDEYRIVDIGGVRIGFIGTVTEQTAHAVAPHLITEVEFGSQLDASNRVAAAIDHLVDATILLAHDGSPSANCAVIAAEQSVFGVLAREVSPQIDAIVAAHTHLASNCVISGRPVMQPGFYGSGLGKIGLSFDAATGELVAAASEILPLVEGGAAVYPDDPAVAAIVAAAVENADALGKLPVGTISADIVRGGSPPGSDRGVESPLGNLIADITVDAVPGADIGVINPGSLRADLLRRPDGTVSYRDVASVQPFANTLVAVGLTGAQLKTLLEEQWYLLGEVEAKRHLSISKDFAYEYDASRPSGDRILSMTLRGAPIDETAVYRVVTNSFLAFGGDGFTVFVAGSDHFDTGRNDLQATVDYFAAHPMVDPPAVGRAKQFVVPDPEPPPTPNDELAPTGAPGDAGSPAPLVVGGALLLTGALLAAARAKPRRRGASG